MKKITYLSTATLLTANLFLAGCSEALHSNVYQINEVGRTSKINKVYITHVHRVRIDNAKITADGATAGALAGGISGAILGNSAQSTVFGALAGGLTGAALSQSERYTPGVSIEFRNKGGKLKNIVQVGHKHNFKPGPAKEVITYLNNGQRYTHIQANKHYG